MYKQFRIKMGIVDWWIHSNEIYAAIGQHAKSFIRIVSFGT